MHFERTKGDLLKLIFWPEMSQNVLRTLLIVVQFLFVALANNTSSSAKKRWVKEGPFLETNSEPVTSFDFRIDEPS